MATTNPSVETKFFAYLNFKLSQQNSEPIDPADYEPATPEVYAGSTPATNTRIIFRPPLISPIIGNTVVYYDRGNLAMRSDLVVVRGAATSISDVLSQISDQIGIQLTLNDVVQKTLPASGPVVLEAKASCLLFYGSTNVAIT